MRHAWVVGLLLALVAGCSGPAAESEPPETTAAVTEPLVAHVPTPDPLAGVRHPLPVPTTASRPQPETAGLDTARRYTEMFYRGDLEPLFEKFSVEMRSVVPLERLVMMREHAVEAFGKEIGVIAEETDTQGEYRGFVRWARFDGTDEVIEVQWILRPDDEVAGFFIRPAAHEDGQDASGSPQP